MVRSPETFSVLPGPAVYWAQRSHISRDGPRSEGYPESSKRYSWIVGADHKHVSPKVGCSRVSLLLHRARTHQMGLNQPSNSSPRRATSASTYSGTAFRWIAPSARWRGFWE